MLAWQLLRDLDCGQLDGAADGWGAVSNSADAARDRVDNEMTGKVGKTQEGEAAGAAVKRLQRLSQNYAYAQTECGLVRSVLNGLAAELRVPQQALKQALAEAAERQFTVEANGTVSYPAGGANKHQNGAEYPGGRVAGRTGLLEPRPSPDGKFIPGDTSRLVNQNPNHALAADIADRIAGAVREANETDARYSGALGKLKAKEGLAVDSATWGDAAKDAAAVRDTVDEYLKGGIPTEATPAERKAWWDDLTQEQREEYLAVYPDVIGNLDGVPSLVRDEANRNNLPLLMAKLEGQGGEDSQTMLNGLRAIDQKLQAGSEPPMLLLGVGEEGNGRAIIAYGNPDTAKNVAAYVPGLDTKLDEQFAGGTVKRAHDTALGAKEADPDSATSSIVWLGYDAPQLSLDELPFGDKNVMKEDHAEAGAPAYNEFMAGISATNEGADPHVTAIGHSYGSLTVGLAAQQEGGIPGADDIIIVGSPGTSADHAEDLNVGKEHVFVGAADNDIVSKLPNPDEADGLKTGALGGGSAGAVLGLGMGGPLGAAVGGIGGAAVGGIAGYLAQDAQTDPSQIYFGTDPAHKDFGATRFLVDDGKPLVPGGVDAHSNYFNPRKDQMSADNIANIVVGRSDEIVLERPR
ncbi:alpha/beta hydrolase [Streptomyces sp. NPDC127068]|uniref:alpha/beta hydrolase n=1 Tax=Streptomyces sp. NPDC127068 TaxID=3347127 RepID=UPI00365D1E7C